MNRISRRSFVALLAAAPIDEQAALQRQVHNGPHLCRVFQDTLAEHWVEFPTFAAYLAFQASQYQQL